MSTDAPQVPDADDSPVDPRQLLDAALPDDDTVEPTPDADPTDNEPASSEKADVPKPEGDDATDTPPVESTSSAPDNGEDTSLSPLAELDRIGGTNYAAGDEAEGWRRVHEDLRVARAVVPHLGKLQSLIAKDRAQAESQTEPEKETPPAEDDLVWDPAYDHLTQESDPKLIAAYQAFSKKVAPRTVANIRETATLKKELAELRGMIEKQATDAQQTTQQQRDQVEYDAFVAEHTDKMFVDGDSTKGHTPFGEAFQRELSGDTFYDTQAERARMPVKPALRGAFALAAASHPSVFAPKAPADAPRKPSASGMKQGPNTAKPRAKSAAEFLSEQLESAGPNFDMSVEVERALQAAEAD